jgi:branched-chain amino acid transport system substrate-binding protein
MYKRVLWLVVGLMLLVALPACGGGAKSETIKIALLSPLSGDVATFGQSINNGAMLAIEDKNASGGVLGRQIEVVTEDSQCSPEAAVSAANKVIDQDGVKFIIGEVCSSASIPVSEVAMAKGVFQITGPSTNPNVTVDEAGKTKSLIFRACFIDIPSRKRGREVGWENLGAKDGCRFLLDQGNDYVRGLSEYFRDSFEAKWR